MNNNQKVHKKILKNGLTVLVRPTHNIPKVSIQLWYNVGSKDEKNGQKGLAHLLEHMIFKGTKELSESDINLITHKLSGYTNAFTSYDYTGYLFDFPSHHWQEALPILADCMKNCKFDQEMLNSELKAVIQELKMYKDDYDSTLVENMVSTIFAGHPYSHPIIGYKHDLWNINRENLIEFYKKYYVPNNATLVIVGDVDPQEVFDLAQNNFGNIAKDENFKKDEYNVVKDLGSKSVTLHRDIAQPSVVLAVKIPGALAKVDYAVDVISWILAQGRGSILYKKLVDELELVIDVDSFSYDLIDQGVFFIHFTPKEQSKINEIIEIIKSEIELLANNGPTEQELKRATKKVETSYLSLLENNQKQAYVIGKSFLATGDENYIFNYLLGNNSDLSVTIKNILNNYFATSLINIGQVLPMSEKDKSIWNDLQILSDQEDARVLSGKVRNISVEPGIKVHLIDVKPAKKFDFPKPSKILLNNGIEVFYHDNKNLPKIDLVLELKAKHHFDPDEKLGIGNFVSNMLLEGTSKLSSSQLAHELESLGIKLNISTGYITMSMLSSDFQKGLSLLTEILTDSVFKESSIEKVRKQIISDIKEYWDEPSSFIAQLAKEHIYDKHHYKKNILGTIETISKISRADLIDYYKKFISPHGALLAIVGDIQNYNIQSILSDTLEKWQGSNIDEMQYCDLIHVSPKEINHYINRDQVVLCYAGLSISRKHSDYDKLLLFDQIFSGGVLGSMSSRLFQLREQSGLFYTIGGSLISRADHQPGMSFIKTIVSTDRLKEAEELIEKTIDCAANEISHHEYNQAKNALINSLVDNFASSKQIANTFLFLRKYDFARDYFDNRAEQISKIQVDEIKNAIANVLHTNKMIKLRAGRV